LHGDHKLLSWTLATSAIEKMPILTTQRSLGRSPP